MRDNSIDCQLNKRVSYFDPEVFNFKTRVASSQGTVALSYKWGDRNTDYQTTCPPLLPGDESGKDDSTFTTDMYLDDVGYYADFILTLYRKSDSSFDYTKTFTYEEIHDGVKNLMSNMDEDILKYTLNVLLNSDQSREYLAFIGKKYIIMPTTATFGYVTMKERQKYKPLVLERLVAKDEANAAPNAANSNANSNSVTIPNILERITERITACKAKLAKKFHHQLQTVIVDYVIDRLSGEELDTLFLQDSIPSNVKASLQRAGASVELELGKTAYRTPFKPNVWVWKGENQRLEIVPPVEINKHATKVKNLLQKHIINEHVCFLDYNSTYGYQFKLIDKDKPKSTGSDCARTATNTREILIKTIQDRGFEYEELLAIEDSANAKNNKSDLCFLVEIATRHFNNGELIKRPLHYKDFIESQKVKKTATVVNTGVKKRGRKPKVAAAP
jgi:hypothetical protein